MVTLALLVAAAPRLGAVAGVKASGPAAAKASGLAAAKASGLRVARFHCEISGGRKHILAPRKEENESDDELSCGAELAGVGRQDQGALAGEVRLEVPGRPVRVVAAGEFRALDEGRARLPDLYVPHSTWASAIDWRDRRRPRLQVVLHVHRKGGTAKRARWLVVATERFVLRGRRGHP